VRGSDPQASSGNEASLVWHTPSRPWGQCRTEPSCSVDSGASIGPVVLQLELDVVTPSREGESIDIAEKEESF
jgi:hypothetical protein